MTAEADFTNAEILALVSSIDAIDGDDPEAAHSNLDDLLAETMPADVQEAIRRLYGRCRWWGTA